MGEYAAFAHAAVSEPIHTASRPAVRERVGGREEVAHAGRPASLHPSTAHKRPAALGPAKGLRPSIARPAQPAPFRGPWPSRVAARAATADARGVTCPPDLGRDLAVTLAVTRGARDGALGRLPGCASAGQRRAVKAVERVREAADVRVAHN